MALPSINPLQMLDSYRKSDSVLIVCQNTAAKAVEIAAINNEAERMLELCNDELVGKPLATILPQRIAEAIADFTEYEVDGSDLAEVLTKIRHFAIKDSKGRERGFKLRVIRGEAIDRNPWFHLVLVDESEAERGNAVRDMLKLHFKGHEVLNEQNGLPNRASVLRNLELVIPHVTGRSVTASFAILDINRYDELLKTHGKATCDLLYRHIAQLCKLKLRAEDMVGTLSERSLGILLLDAAQEPARMVLNRLRWAIGVSPLELPGNKSLTAQVNVSFSELDGRISETAILERCEEYMKQQRLQAHNAVQLVVTHERRGSLFADRRRTSMPIENDRRLADRRKP